MIETLRHKEAFEYYYSLGDKRSCHKVGIKFAISRQSIEKWAKNFNWKERVGLRDIDNGKKLEAKTDKTIVNSKADYRAEIKTQLGILKAILNKVIQDFKKNEILDVENVKDLEKVINSYEKLCKLDLLMMGESTERGELKILNAKQKLMDKINNITSKGTESEDTE